MNKVFNCIAIVLLIVAIVGSGLYIGDPITENFQLMYIVISVIGIVVIVINKLQNKEYKIINNKLDILMFLLMISSLFSVIFKTYASFNDAIRYIFRYFTIFVIYFVAKSAISKNKRYINYITITIIIVSVFLVILGIDNLTNENFLWLTSKLGITSPLNLEKRMFSTFGYANAFAGAIGLGFILSVGQYLNTKSKIKFVYASTAFILLSGIILSYSRTTLIILGITLIIYLVLVKNREKRFEIIELCFITGILSLIFSSLFERNLTNKSYNFIWIELLIFVLATITIEKIINLNNKNLMKITNKHIAIIAGTIVILFVSFVLVGLKLVKPLSIFYDDKSSKEIKFKITGIKPNSTYVFDFDILAKSNTVGANNYTIEIIEENKYNDSIKEHTIEINNFEGIKQIEIFTSNETSEFALIFKNIYLRGNNGLTINKLTINNKEYPLDYAYLPNTLVNRLKNMRLNSKEVVERFVVSKDACKLIKDNLAFGIGGNGWQYRYGEVQSYNYDVREIHCYIIEIFLEFGILGFIAICGIMIFTIYNGVRMTKNEIEIKEKITYISIFVGLVFIFARSLMDFDLTYMYLLIITYTLIGIISETIEGKKYKIINYVSSFLTVLIALIVIYFNFNNIIINNKLEETGNSEEYINLLNIAIQKVPYQYSYKKEKEQAMEFNSVNMSERINNMIDINKYEPYVPELFEMAYNIAKTSLEKNDKNLEKALESSYEIMRREVDMQNLKVNNVIEINEMIYNIANKIEEKNNEKLNKVAIKFYNLIIDNYQKNKESISNHTKNRADYFTIDVTEKELDEIYNNTLKNLEYIV